jgi:hypothetical protein
MNYSSTSTSQLTQDHGEVFRIYCKTGEWDLGGKYFRELESTLMIMIEGIWNPWRGILNPSLGVPRQLIRYNIHLKKCAS